MRECFSQQIRLRTRLEFRQVFSQGQKYKAGCMTLLARPNGLEHPRLGISIARKQIRSAVKRNTIKRVLRESFRRQPQLAGHDLVVLVYHDCEGYTRAELRQRIERLWTKLTTGSSAS